MGALGRICGFALLLTATAAAYGAQLQGSVAAGGGNVSLSTEGGSDWVHWGLSNPSSVNRKAGVTAQISTLGDVIDGPTGRFAGNGAVHSSLGWSGGTPTASQPGSTAGLYYATANSGYQFTVPAGSTTRTLKVYLGGYQARSRVEATLSDGSAPAYSTTLQNLGGIYHNVLTLTFQGASAGSTLTFRHILEQGGNVTIQGAALSTSGGAANQAPSIAPIGNKSVTVGSNLGFAVSATDTDGPAPIALTIAGSSPALPGAAAFTDNGNGSGAFSWTPTAAQAGSYDVTFRARDGGGSGAFSERQITIVVSAASTGGTLGGSADPVSSPGTVNLTTLGSADWVHWGLSNPSSVNRKTGVSAQISGLGSVLSGPSGRFAGNGSVHSSLAWSDGTPTGNQSGTTAGIYYATLDSGYEFTVPAGGASRTLRVYLGGYQARSRVEATLSDGSAPAYSTTLQNLGGVYHHVVTLTFQAASAGATLTFRHILEQGVNVTLQGATLTGGGGTANQAPSIAPIGNKSVTVGSNLGFAVSATDTDGPAPIALTISGSSPALPGAASFTDNGNGSGAFSWTPTAAQAGSYDVTFRARDGGGSGAFSERQITIVVSAASTGGTLGGSADPVSSPGTVNLTAQGSADWVHWGLGSISSVNRKAGVSTQISGLGNVLSGPSGRFAGNGSVHSSLAWSDGTPTASQSGSTAGLYYANVNSGYEFTVPAGGSPRTLKVYLGGYQARTRVEATLSDGSAPAYVTTLQNLGGVFHSVVTLTFQGASAGATLTFRHILEQGGNVTLQGATLSGGGGGGGFSLPYSNNFSNGFTGWTVIDEADAASNWQVTGGVLRQNNRLESVFAFDESYHLGSFAYRPDASGLTSYRLQTTARYLSTGFQEDLGVMFRYQNPDNYYRLALNGRYGFARLEKRVAGRFTALATNARGYRGGEELAFDIIVDGDQILVTINGDPLFAVTDGSLGSGGFALYTQDNAQFDDLSVTALPAAPQVVLAAPVAHTTAAGTSVTVRARVRNAPAGASVRFLLDGRAMNDASAPYSRTFSNVSPGNHTVVAILRNGANQEVDRDTNLRVGSAGRAMVGVGDSITNGVGDNFEQDNVSALERIIAAQGYEAPLTDLLDAGNPDQPALVFNEGIGGDETFDAAFSRVASILARHADARTILIGLGTNDALALVPSGAGCTGNGCQGTFKGNLQTLVDKIRWLNYPANTQPSGITPVIARVPPAWNSATPWTSMTNNRIRSYNAVIESEINGVSVGPSLFDYFLPSASVSRVSLFADTLHPNGLGHRVLSGLWYNALNPGTPVALPFILDNLQTSGPVAVQQNLLGSGDSFYVDAAHRLGNVPGVLSGGRWIMTSSGGVSNAGSNYLSFTLDRAARVYVAFDGGASATPAWMSGFSDTGTNLPTTDPASPTLRLYARNYPAGAVTLGGNAQAPSSGANSAYVVIVVEQ